MFKKGFKKLIAFILKLNRLLSTTVLLTILFIAFIFFTFSSTPTSENELYWKEFLKNNRIFSVLVPKNIQFANEKMPSNDFSVMESMERELLLNTYFHSQTLLMHKRANRWFPIIEPILKKNGIPEDFKYLSVIESNLSNTTSPKGACGFWQLLENTAKQYGLEINDEIDERYHVEKSTEAACKYFNAAYQTFGNWTLVAASYNMGMDGLKKQLEKQKVNSYYDLSLNDETARYIFRILSIKEILSMPKNYGYQLRKKDLYPPLTTMNITIDSTISDLALFAQANKVSYKILKYFNPWLRQNSLNMTNKKPYTIQFPTPEFNDTCFKLIATEDGSELIKSDTLIPTPPDSPNKND